jgi:hypothetical protein
LAKLGKRQQKILELVEEEGLDPGEAGRRMGIGGYRGRQVYQKAKARRESRVSVAHNATELRNPEGAAIAFDMLTDPFPKTLREIAQESGIPEKTLENLSVRIRSLYSGTSVALREVKASNLVRKIEHSLDTVLDSLTRETVESLQEVPIRDRAVVTGILVDKRQLLRGEPTQIMGTDDRVKMNDLIQSLTKEAARRGMEIDVTPPRDGEDAPADAEVVGGSFTGMGRHGYEGGRVEPDL